MREHSLSKIVECWRTLCGGSGDKGEGLLSDAWWNVDSVYRRQLINYLISFGRKPFSHSLIVSSSYESVLTHQSEQCVQNKAGESRKIRHPQVTQARHLRRSVDDNRNRPYFQDKFRTVSAITVSVCWYGDDRARDLVETKTKIKRRLAKAIGFWMQNKTMTEAAVDHTMKSRTLDVFLLLFWFMSQNSNWRW